MSRDLVERTAAMTTQTLERAGIGWNDVTRVLLVGGATRLPMIRDMLLLHAGREPDFSVCRSRPSLAERRCTPLSDSRRLAAHRRGICIS